MSFFNDLGKKISETSQGAVSKTRTMAETSRLNSAINDCKNKIEFAYREIGNFYVQKYSENPDPEIAEKVNLIKELEGSIKNMQEEIRKINGFIQCPKCGKIQKDGMIFCDVCGEKLREPEPAAECCPNCGMPYRPGAVFCTRCGRPRDAMPQQNEHYVQYYNQEQEPQMQQPAQPEQDFQENVVNPKPKICPECGYEMDASQSFCLRCGEKL